MNYYELGHRIARLSAYPQSLAVEEELVRLRWKRESMYSARRVRVISRALILFDAYQKTGGMVVVHADGRCETQDPYTNCDPITAMWNVRSTAEALADRSTEWGRTP